MDYSLETTIRQKEDTFFHETVPEDQKGEHPNSSPCFSVLKNCWPGTPVRAHIPSQSYVSQNHASCHYTQRTGKDSVKVRFSFFIQRTG